LSGNTSTARARRRDAAIGVSLAALACALSAGAAVLIARDAAPDERVLSACVHVVSILLPVGVGLARLARRRDDRFARLLIATGLAWSVVSLAEASDETLYSIGRVAAWLVDPALIFLLLAFPSGRLERRVDRRLFAFSVAIAATLYVPTALLAPYPEPSPFATCGTDCPANAFIVTDALAGFVDDVVRPVREVMTVLVYAAVAVVLVRRLRGEATLIRRALVPVAVVAILRTVSLVVYLPFRAEDVDSLLADVLGWIWVASLALVSLAFGIGLLRERLFVANALERLTLGLRPHATAPQLREALAGALEDPSLRILYRVDGEPERWVDENGATAELPKAEPGRVVAEVSSGEQRIAAIGHDVSLARDPALVEAATSYALAALENERLVGELQASLDELSRSRSRLVAVADAERRRIERDLHDGAQQRLVALRARLELVAERLEAESPTSAEAVRALGGEVEGTIDEVRSFARGIYPSLLIQRGLAEALRAAGRSAPLPAVVDTDGIGRYPPEIEATVYFACMEALQNAAKHARGASGLVVSVTRNPHLRFEVRDDGEGFDPTAVSAGNGLTNMRDRLAAVGGALHVESAPGAGCVVSGVIPRGQV
jgi:signal transduction histidine kinase